MSRIRNRKGNRLPVKVETPIVFYLAEARVEGQVLNESTTGVAVLIPAESGLQVGQSVRIMYKRKRQLAKVARVELSEEGDRIGLKLDTR